MRIGLRHDGNNRNASRRPAHFAWPTHPQAAIRATTSFSSSIFAGKPRGTGVSFLLSVSDRLGFYGNPGEGGVSWGKRFARVRPVRLRSAIELAVRVATLRKRHAPAAIRTLGRTAPAAPPCGAGRRGFPERSASSLDPFAGHVEHVCSVAQGAAPPPGVEAVSSSWRRGRLERRLAAASHACDLACGHLRVVRRRQCRLGSDERSGRAGSTELTSSRRHQPSTSLAPDSPSPLVAGQFPAPRRFATSGMLEPTAVASSAG
jgi:hypothetical protein